MNVIYDPAWLVLDYPFPSVELILFQSKYRMWYIVLAKFSIALESGISKMSLVISFQLVKYIFPPQATEYKFHNISVVANCVPAKVH